MIRIRLALIAGSALALATVAAGAQIRHSDTPSDAQSDTLDVPTIHDVLSGSRSHDEHGRSNAHPKNERRHSDEEVLQRQERQHADGDDNDNDQDGGAQNDGDHNDGNHNDGDHNDGDHNDGDHNDGHHNDGDHNDGDHNDGDHNDRHHNDRHHNDG